MSDTLLDDLLDDSQTNYLKKSCPSLFDDSGAPKFSYNKLLSTDESLIIPDGLKYYQVVETGNNYVSDLLNEEEKYLKEKYGESLYNYFVTKRGEYIDSKMKSVCSQIVSGDGSSDSTNSDSLIVALAQQLNSLGQTISTYSEVSKNKERKGETQLLNSRKFYYRSNAMKDANKMDMLMSAIYYFILIVCVFYLVWKGRIDLKNKGWVYALLILLPLLLSRIYTFGVRRVHELQETVSEQGPKKAFLNQL